MNLAADNLASLGTEVDCIIHLEMLMDGSLTQPLAKGKKGKAEAAAFLKLIQEASMDFIPRPPGKKEVDC